MLSLSHQQRAAVFRARRRLGAVPVAQVIETMRPLPVTPLAAMPGFVLGLAVICGAPVPVVDAGALLGAPDVPQITRFVLLRVAERSVALGLEEVLGVREIPQHTLAQLLPLLHGTSGELVASIGVSDTDFLLLLQGARLLAEIPENLVEAADA